MYLIQELLEYTAHSLYYEQKEGIKAQTILIGIKNSKNISLNRSINGLALKFFSV